ncbi:RagB/SusD family nutrient uptake outer membrane protein [Algoriphagus sp. Y33]|uniref:RagB/SusD family nutrient uptake outer membrane protein n=1 Tax=Algoriphagus sp. Y33 TaxID=2772483 RepID=UPI001784FF24|nr:RagB/SusD family nutrient uptake outer membrane protein [Algoriphagus sp. Y33]
MKLNRKYKEKACAERNTCENGKASSPIGKGKIRFLWILLVYVLGACQEYLDIVPDNVATIENAFKLRNEAEKYLFTCYSYLPLTGDAWYNVGMFAGDEIWLPQSAQTTWHAAFRIAQGQQNKDAPLFDEWGGARKGGANYRDEYKIFRGIRHCNIFLENVKDLNKVPDLPIEMRERWIGEVEFLLAYYHYYLFRMYGPIPIINENTPIDVPATKRMPVDECVQFISDLLSQAAEKLPSRIVDENSEFGRVNKSIALAVKAKLWVYAASPLFNGNSDYANFRDHEDDLLFNSDYDLSKWEKARDAAKEAIDEAEQSGHALYRYENDVLGLSSETKTQLNIRNAVTGRWSKEHVWALSGSSFINQNLCMPPMQRGSQVGRHLLSGLWGAPLKIARMFYTKNGIPIEEDKTLDFSDHFELRNGTEQERFYIEPNERTARLNFDREPRFYADLGFDGGIWYMKDGNATGSDVNTFFVRSKNSERAGYGDFVNWNETGYFVKKLVHWESTTQGSTEPVWKNYPWPEIRLADLYLLYAEALNEVEPGSSTAIAYLDKIRERAGLNGVVESWQTYSTNPGKYSTQGGLREIIHRERMIELAFEGQRFWDLRRWKKSLEELNKDITGMNIIGKSVEAYNNERVIYSQGFIGPRDYLWPIGNFDIRRNSNLVENPGW